MAIKMIAIDLDDTLLREDLTISDTNKRAIRAAEERGIRVVLSSGRNIHSMGAYATELGLDGEDDYLICSNGAEIIHMADRGIIHEIRFRPELCTRIADAIDSMDMPWQIYEHGIIHTSKPNKWALADSKLTGQPTILVEDRDEFFAAGVIKFVIPGEPEVVTELAKKLQLMFPGEAEILISKPYFLELLPPGVDKGNALTWLATRLGIQMVDVMAIGDAMNDFGMISKAGFGCVPSNAIDALKKIARVISPHSHENDAVADLISTVALAS